MRKCILKTLHPANENVYVVDSMPLPICRLARCKSCKTMRGVEQREPKSGYCAAQHEFSFGYKFHAVCSPGGGIIMAYDIAPANITKQLMLITLLIGQESAKELKSYFLN